MTKPYMTDEGYRAYRSTLLLLLIKAVCHLFEGAHFNVHQSVNRSTYVEFENMCIGEDDAEKLKLLMKEYIDENIPLPLKSVPKAEAARLLSGNGNSKRGNTSLSGRVLRTGSL